MQAAFLVTTTDLLIRLCESYITLPTTRQIPATTALIDADARMILLAMERDVGQYAYRRKSILAARKIILTVYSETNLMSGYAFFRIPVKETDLPKAYGSTLTNRCLEATSRM